MIDPLSALIVILVTGLIFGTAYSIREYCRNIGKAKKEYNKAKDIVEDIIFSFSRELKREAEKIEGMSYKVEEVSAKTEVGITKTEGIERQIKPFENQINKINLQIDELGVTIKAVSNNSAKAQIERSSIEFENIETKIQNVMNSQEKIKTRITELEIILEEQKQKFQLTGETPSDHGPPIIQVMPIKRDKAIGTLTDTEVAVLEFLLKEGPKTAPEIKEKIDLSREHTARLMKRLYEEGYLERETGKLPFKYSVKKEMEALLTKQGAPST
jgi:chromosome segregation ATPase